MIVSHQLAQDEGNYVGGFAVAEYSTAETKRKRFNKQLMEWPSGEAKFKFPSSPGSTRAKYLSSTDSSSTRGKLFFFKNMEKFKYPN